MVKTLQEVKESGLEHYEHKNGVYEYRTEDGVQHLSIDGKDVLENLKATNCWYYRDGVYEYKTKDGYYHLNINGKDVLENLKAIACNYRGNGEYLYKTKNGGWHRITRG